MLKDLITPHLLRRMKADIQTHISLPNKNEQVLFCRLTDEQKTVYREFLENSNIIPEIINGNYKAFVGISRLRTICNHPDLYQSNLVRNIYFIACRCFMKMFNSTNFRYFIENFLIWLLEKIR